MRTNCCKIVTCPRMVRLIQSKAFRERLEKTRVGVLLRVLSNHRRSVGFERDVDQCHRILLRDAVPWANLSTNASPTTVKTSA